MWRDAMPVGRASAVEMAAPMINEAADRVPAVVTRTGRQRRFSEEDKQRIVEETCRPGQLLSAAARRYGIDRRLVDAAASRYRTGEAVRRRSARRVVWHHPVRLAEQIG
jgi:hypothetical protein